MTNCYFHFIKSPLGLWPYHRGKHLLGALCFTKLPIVRVCFTLLNFNFLSEVHNNPSLWQIYTSLICCLFVYFFHLFFYFSVISFLLKIEIALIFVNCFRSPEPKAHTVSL